MNPDATASAPLRNHIRLELSAPPEEVWNLVGDLSRFPEYSSGLDAVAVTLDEEGQCAEYTCRFKPLETSADPILHREVVTWYEPNRGFASNAEEPNVFGITRATTRVTLEPSGNRDTLLVWEQYFDAENMDMMREEFDRALTDIGSNLVSRFGGAVVEGTSPPAG